MTGFSLHPFPGQDSGTVTIQGTIARTATALQVSFLLHGNLRDLVLPSTTEGTRDDNLWQATCLELFWGEEGRKNYWELNLAPNEAWNVYAFTDYRTGMHREERVAKPLLQIKHTAESFALTAELGIGNLHTGLPPLMVGVSAVLKHQDFHLSYWALAHPEDKPDFHAPQAFLLRV
ncbi:MAG: hypothetical protein A2505_01480 [Deltaproteobacteria bacterium RIFOXYD12_FULL_55_16]|nr:MAG: hypothetical protein A2505_01480 [Deltaproteobacteria bacterium RIFOXYD12_FULL_55_16]